jgi:ABC-type phosphate/phosphonate transport system substrate-binding protein
MSTQKLKPGFLLKTGILPAAFYVLFLVFNFAGCGKMSQGSLGQESVKMVVLPAYSTGAMSQKYLPLLGYLSRETGYEIQYIWGQSYTGVGAAIETSGADFVFCDPLASLVLQKTHQAKPLVISLGTDGLSEVRGVILVPRSSTLTYPALAKGKVIACASMQSSEGFLSQAYYLFIDKSQPLLLQNNGPFPGRDYQLLICGTMDAVINKVADGQADAGFVSPECLETAKKRGLVPLVRTEPVPGWLCLSLKSDNFEAEEKLTQAFLRLNHKNAQHQKILFGLGYSGFASPAGIDFKGLADKARSLYIPF